jgi:HlyD family secretion protein
LQRVEKRIKLDTINKNSGAAVTGANMDQVIPRRRGKRNLLIGIAVVALLFLGYVVWQSIPQGLQVNMGDLRVAAVEQAEFIDDISVRATAVSLQSVILDSVESGRVEEVFAKDGALVKKGELLFRLSNSQRQLELLARQSDYTTQISNLSNLRVGHELGRTDRQRRLADLEFQVEQAQKTWDRNSQLARDHFISNTLLQESADKLALQKRLLAEERISAAAENKIREDSIKQFEHAIAGLQAGLALVNASVEALAVRAPVAGRLTDFNLQVGETVRPDRRIGRIDDPSRFKVAAEVDEFYLNRVSSGIPATAQSDGQPYKLTVSRVFPQIKSGRFTVELTFVNTQPEGMRPGQSMDLQITLGERTPALLLPNGAFVNDSGGTWVYVLNQKGDLAEKRTVKLGRRSNNQIEVVSGLTRGERVIVSGYASYGKANKLQIK